MNVRTSANAAQPPERDDAALLFSIFVYVSDRRQDITVQEVERFQRLIEHVDWAVDGEFRSSLGEMRRRYTSLWASYTRQELQPSLESITAGIEVFRAACDQAEDDRRKTDLRTFVDRICQSAQQEGRLDSASLRSRAQHGEEITALVADHPSGSATVRPADEQRQSKERPAGPAALSHSPATSEVRRGGRINLRCVAVVTETADVKTFEFIAEPPLHFVYRPGQFITLELPLEGRTIRRSYTLSSSPSRPHKLSITVKRVPEGLVSGWLHANVGIGSVLTASGPYGDFSCEKHGAGKLLLIAAGSGITPIMSMLRWTADTSASPDVVLINNVRTPDDIIFAHELHYLSARLAPSVRLAIVPRRLSSGRPWNGLVGPFDETLLRYVVPDLAQRQVFLCGPSGYMDTVKSKLRQLGLPEEACHSESFGPAGPTSRAGVPARSSSQPLNVATAPELPVPPGAPAAAQDDIEIFFKISGRRVVCTVGELILDVAERHNIPLAKSCRAGICGSCKVQKLAGRVNMSDHPALSDGEVAEGQILTCVAEVAGPLVIDA